MTFDKEIAQKKNERNLNENERKVVHDNYTDRDRQEREEMRSKYNDNKTQIDTGT